MEFVLIAKVSFLRSLLLVQCLQWFFRTVDTNVEFVMCTYKETDNKRKKENSQNSGATPKVKKLMT